MFSRKDNSYVLSYVSKKDLLSLGSVSKTFAYIASDDSLWGTVAKT
ncbi:F-box protein [Legionella sp. CNM-1927-20]